MLATVFENYKSLDESLPLGMMKVFMPASRLVAPALAPAVKLYSLLHDILTPEAQLKLCRYCQVIDPQFLHAFLVIPICAFLSLCFSTKLKLSFFRLLQGRG